MNSRGIGDLQCWYAVHTKPKQEQRADSNLRAWSIETFAPRFKERRCNQYNGRPTYLIKPLFPGYVFARFRASDLLHKICFTRGVDKVVSFGGVPAPVDDRIITILQQRREEDGFIKMGEECDPGDRVVIVAGPLKDFTGIFQHKLTEGERVAVLLTSINYQASVVVEKDSIRKQSGLSAKAG